MMRVLDIPERQWLSFFRMLNGIAAGRPVRLEVLQRQLGDEEMAHLLPLRTIEFESKGSARGDVFVVVGLEQEQLTHQIVRPVRMVMALNELAEPEWLGIREEDGGTTIIYFERLPAIEAEYA